jgi:hypothetical protein
VLRDRLGRRLIGLKMMNIVLSGLGLVCLIRGLVRRLDIDENGVAVLVDDVVADLLALGEKTLDPAKAGVAAV